MPKAKKLELEVSPTALKEIGRAVRIGLIDFREDAALRYERLIEQAIFDIAEQPLRPGSKARDHIGRGLRTYHLSLSRDRARTETGKVANPRHFILYRVIEQPLKIVRLIHDFQDFDKLRVKP